MTGDNSNTAATWPPASCQELQGNSPSRAFRLTLKLEADSRDDLSSALMQMARQIDREELTVGVSGGPSSGAIYELLHNPHQTHENYFRQVHQYLQDAKNKTAAQPMPAIDPPPSAAP